MWISLTLVQVIEFIGLMSLLFCSVWVSMSAFSDLHCKVQDQAIGLCWSLQASKFISKTIVSLFLYHLCKTTSNAIPVSSTSHWSVKSHIYSVNLLFIGFLQDTWLCSFLNWCSICTLGQSKTFRGKCYLPSSTCKSSSDWLVPSDWWEGESMPSLPSWVHGWFWSRLLPALLTTRHTWLWHDQDLNFPLTGRTLFCVHFLLRNINIL